jgi:hypothetical protein
VNFPFLPDEVRGNTRPHRPIWLFVKRPEWPDYLHLGQLEAAYSWGGRTGRWEANFSLKKPVPETIWGELQGPGFLLPDHARLDAALSRLGPTADAETRFAVLRELTTYWHGPIGAEDGLSEETCSSTPMPNALMRWYRWAGRRSAILSAQNVLLRPEPPQSEGPQPYRLRMSDSRLLFYTENQGCYFWSTLAKGEDPPVFGRAEMTGPWQPEGMTLTEHLILACLFEAILCHSPYGANCVAISRTAAEEIAAFIPPVAISPWRWLDGAAFHAGHGAFMVLTGLNSPDEQSVGIWVGAKSQTSLNFLHSIGYIDWEYAAF